MFRSVLSTVLELTGAAAVLAGVAVVSVPAAVVVAGLVLIGVGYLAGAE